ncbi:hypothetical protein LWP59_01225 [Amycolatopsis acidiphila]|uniref:hypothetical protein n=1 Tax=Amycolatopsis acidiphila TaxID=715473 RepID=UPI0016437C6D|nr:hypothetical protein [Amycolatopsis acidiphila]UIJ60350.1 hypothetical protein LWP59_01225 [Amycolatopsis acidiphila]GHG90552.1 hypothetical protein GCM10017788_66240 [Amycolatopsis acidiphila]
MPPSRPCNGIGVTACHRHRRAVVDPADRPRAEGMISAHFYTSLDESRVFNFAY